MTLVFMRGQDRVEIGTARIPRHKQKALVRITGARTEVLGYFRTEDDRRRFEDALNQVMRICNDGGEERVEREA
jgi:hypothetical protein